MTRRKAVWVRILVCVCFLSGFFCFVFENFVLDELQSSGCTEEILSFPYPAN